MKGEFKKMNIKEESQKNTNLKEHKTTIKKLKRQVKGITLIALVVTILFSYDEKIKCSNSKGFLLLTI